jgi:hypothetical protein
MNPRVRPQLVSDAVIAGYIHDISVRHRPESASPQPDASGSAAGRFASPDETDLPELVPLAAS